MNKILRKTKNLFIYIKCFILYYIALFIGFFIKNTPYYKDMWLISERKTDARDNGYHFFKYLNAQHPEINSVYIIEKKSADYKKVKNIGKIIEPYTFKHYLAFACAKVRISTHLMGTAPDTYRFAILDRKLGLIHKHGKNVIIRHGIAGYTLSELFYPLAKPDLLVCTANPEYKDMIKNYNYPNGVIQQTGLCRYDALLAPHEIKKQILVMPTWRYHLRTMTDNEFKNSLYYKQFNELINNSELLALLNKYDYNIVLYLHYELQPYTHLFKITNKHIILADFNKYDVQQLLKESAMLITDFSSIHFDFAYMEKPLAYLQFDEELFYSTQYKKGYFDFKKNGFGPVYEDQSKLISFIKKELEVDMKEPLEYKKRIKDFFLNISNHNCDNVYAAINNLFI